MNDKKPLTKKEYKKLHKELLAQGKLEHPTNDDIFADYATVGGIIYVKEEKGKK
jgi:hypothetical protein